MLLINYSNYACAVVVTFFMNFSLVTVKAGTLEWNAEWMYEGQGGIPRESTYLNCTYRVEEASMLYVWLLHLPPNSLSI